MPTVVGVGVGGDSEQEEANREADSKDLQRGAVFREERVGEGAHGHHGLVPRGSMRGGVKVKGGRGEGFKKLVIASGLRSKHSIKIVKIEN